MTSPDRPPAPAKRPRSARSAATRPAIETPDAPGASTLDAIARSQQGLVSAEAFWKSAGRMAKLR